MTHIGLQSCTHMTDLVPAALHTDGERGAGGVIPPNATLVRTIQPRPAALVYTCPPLIDLTAGCRCSMWSCWASTDRTDHKREAAVTAAEFLRREFGGFQVGCCCWRHTLCLAAATIQTTQSKHVGRQAVTKVNCCCPGCERGCPVVHLTALFAPTQTHIRAFYWLGGAH